MTDPSVFTEVMIERVVDVVCAVETPKERKESERRVGKREAKNQRLQ